MASIDRAKSSLCKIDEPRRLERGQCWWGQQVFLWCKIGRRPLDLRSKRLWTTSSTIRGATGARILNNIYLVDATSDCFGVAGISRQVD